MTDMDSYALPTPNEILECADRCATNASGRSSADVVLLTGSVEDRRVLLIQRRKAPFRGQLALPGGHVEEGEAPQETASRELREEAGITQGAVQLDLVGVYTGLARDPRLTAQSSAYVAEVSSELDANAGSDAGDVRWVRVADLTAGTEPLAFDHALILHDALAKLDGTASPFLRGLRRAAKAAEVRNVALLGGVDEELGRDGRMASEEVLLKEYEMMKIETVDRIKQRDGFINLNIVAAALLVSFVAANPEQSIALLVLPWSSLCFGWAYLANDEKVSALSKYFELNVAPQLGGRSLGWERSAKRTTNLKRTHKDVQLAVDLLQFVAPTLVAVVTFAMASDQVSAPALVLMTVEVILAAGLGLLFILHSHRVKRFDLGESYWRSLR